MERLEKLRLKIWWWIGYHGLYQIDWWVKKHQFTCRHCGKTVLRAETKKWVKSFCESTGKNVHLIRVYP